MDRRRFLTTLSATALAVHAPLRVAASGTINAVATTGMIADAVRNVGGDLINVRALMGSGIDPHSYRQTRSDIVAMTRADIVFWNGLYLEAQMEDLLLKLQAQKPVPALGETLPKDLLLSHEDYDNQFDPHIWMVPELWASVIKAVGNELSAIAPEHADTFATNVQTHLAELDRVGAYAKDVLAAVPQDARVLVTAHDAFSYFGQAYGYEVMGVQGISTESEAGLSRIRDLVDTLVARKIGAVFVESTVSDRNVRALIEGAAAQGHTVRVGGELFSDAMGPEGTYEATYIGMIDHNATVIAAALGAEVPARGLNGKLSAGS